MFRPLHEMNGNWFWWGAQDPAVYRALWQSIYDFMTKNLGGGRNGGTPRPIGWRASYHIMSSPKIEVTGDTATASSRWAFVTAALGPGIQVAGRYEDTLVREDGVWKIKSRQAFNDLPAKPAATTAAAAPAQK